MAGLDVNEVLEPIEEDHIEPENVSDTLSIDSGSELEVRSGTPKSGLKKDEDKEDKKQRKKMAKEVKAVKRLEKMPKAVKKMKTKKKAK